MTRATNIPALAVSIIAAGFALRIVFALANAYWLDLPHLDSFHRVAAAFAAGETPLDFRISWTYAYVLGFLYAVTGAHEIVGYVASTLAWLGAALALDAILRLLRMAPPARLAALLVFAVMPSSIFYGSTIMRDVYQLLFVNLMLLSALRIGIERDYDAAVPMVLAGIGMSLLHVGLMPVGVVIVLATLAWAVTHRPRQPLKLAVAMLVGVTFAFFVTAMFMRFGYDVSDGLPAASEAYRDSVDDRAPRTEFRLLSLDTGGLVGVMIGFISYMLEPFPWHVQNVGDLGVLGENLFRLVLLGAALWALATNREQRLPILMLLIAYFCLEGVWSLGTVAWGTAIRHHLPGSGLLIAAAFAAFGSRASAQPA